MRSSHSQPANLTALAAALATLVLGAVATAGAEDHAEPMLVGIIIDDREVGLLDVVREDGRFLLPLRPLAELLGCTVDDSGAEVLVETPLGVATFAAGELRELDGITYLDEDLLHSRMATPVTFDAGELALVLEPPWRLGVPAGAAAPPPTPDIRPPRLTLSTLRTDASYVDTTGTGASAMSSTTEVGGSMLGGWWRLRYGDDFAGSHQVQDYAWARSTGRRLLVLGRQPVQLHPLLSGFELTGAQVAATNRSLDSLGRSTRTSDLFSRRMPSVATFTGSGPPGGMAELRLDGAVLTRQIIGLDGSWEFYNVTLPSRQVSRLEVALFDRRNLTVPVEIIEQRLLASDFLMPAGVLLHQGGAGALGNLAQDLIDDRPRSEAAAFYQVRYGVSDNLSIEGAAQHAGSGDQGMAGIVSRLGPHLVTAVGAGIDGDSYGLDIDLEGFFGGAHVLGRSRWLDAGYRGLTISTFDHYIEVGYRPLAHLELSLIGRSRQTERERTDVVSPAVLWQPSPRLSLSARPDLDGSLRVDAFYRPTRELRIALRHANDRTAAELAYDLSRRAMATLATDAGGPEPARYAATVAWQPDTRSELYLLAGVLHSRGEPGYIVSADIQVWSGVRARLEMQSDPFLSAPGQPRHQRFLASVTADLAFVGGRAVAASSRSLRDDRGGIAAIVSIAGERGTRARNLDGLVLLVDGEPRATTSARGSCFVGNLRPGVYTVELDAANLPIELSPERGSLVVEVAAGAVTRASFTVHPEYGFAGRVTDREDRPVPGARLILLTSSEEIAGRTVTDQFGLYRIDGLAPGEYRLELDPDTVPKPLRPGPSRRVLITDDFLFAQDLQLPW